MGKVVMARAMTRRSSEDGAAALGPLAGYLGYALRRAQSASFRHLERSTAELALSPGQFSLLTAVEATPGINQQRLASLFGLDKSTLSPAVDALVRRGLVQRSRAAEDARAWALVLTADGRALLARMRAKVEAQERMMAAALGSPDKAKRLAESLRQIEAAMDAA